MILSSSHDNIIHRGKKKNLMKISIGMFKNVLYNGSESLTRLHVEVGDIVRLKCSKLTTLAMDFIGGEI